MIVPSILLVLLGKAMPLRQDPRREVSVSAAGVVSPLVSELELKDAKHAQHQDRLRVAKASSNVWLSGFSTGEPICSFARTTPEAQIVIFADPTSNSRAYAHSVDAPATESHIVCKGEFPAAACHPPAEKSAAAASPEDGSQLAALASRSCEAITNCPCEASVDRPPGFDYIQKMLEIVVPHCQHQSPVRVLLIGLGGGMMHRYMKHRCEASLEMDTVELSPQVLAAAKKFFGFSEDTKNRVHIAEGGQWVADYAQRLEAEKTKLPFGSAPGGTGMTASPGPVGGGSETTTPAKPFDIVVVDCFSDKGTIPDGCSSDRFVRELKTITVPDHGVIVQNVWEKQIHPMTERYGQVFGATKTKPYKVLAGNYVVESDRNVPPEANVPDGLGKEAGKPSTSLVDLEGVDPPAPRIRGGPEDRPGEILRSSDAGALVRREGGGAATSGNPRRSGIGFAVIEARN